MYGRNLLLSISLLATASYAAENCTVRLREEPLTETIRGKPDAGTKYTTEYDCIFPVRRSAREERAASDRNRVEGVFYAPGRTLITEIVLGDKTVSSSFAAYDPTGKLVDGCASGASRYNHHKLRACTSHQLDEIRWSTEQGLDPHAIRDEHWRRGPVPRKE